MPNNSKRRILPLNLAERSDAEIMDKIFGKRVKKELDKIARDPKAVKNKEVARHLK